MSTARALAGVLAALALAAPASAAAHGGPDAEIFATDNTAVITDPADPRLRDPLTGFAREVGRIVEKGLSRHRCGQGHARPGAWSSCGK